MRVNCKEYGMSEGKATLHNIEKSIYASGMILAALIIAVGVFQPWIFRGWLIGEGSNLHLLVLIGSISIAIFALRFLIGSGSGKDACSIVGVVSLATVLVAIRGIWEVLDERSAEDIGSGLYLLLIGGALSAGCSLTALIRMITKRAGA